MIFYAAMDGKELYKELRVLDYGFGKNQGVMTEVMTGVMTEVMTGVMTPLNPYKITTL